MAKITVRNDSGGLLYLYDFGHQKLANGAQVVLKGNRREFADATHLESLITAGDITVIDDRGDVLPVKQAQRMRAGLDDELVQEAAAHRVVIYGRAVAGSPSPVLTKGTPVYISGYDSVENEYLFELADSDTDSFPAVGVVNGDTITPTQGGSVVIQGRIENWDTSAWSVGTGLFVSDTGTLTSTKPVGTINKIQRIAQVVHSHATEGVIMIIGAGRANDVPNISTGKVWMGDGSGAAVETDVYTEAEADANFVLKAGDTVSGNLVISGDLTVNGTTTTVNTADLNVADNIIRTNSDYTGSSPTENGGVEVERGTLTNASIIWDETADVWKAGLSGSEVEISLLGHTHADLSITAGEGLSGGGDLSTGRTLGIDVNGLTEEASVNGATDYFVMYDASAGAHRKVLGENLPGGAGASTLSELTDTNIATPTNGDYLLYNGTHWENIATATTSASAVLSSWTLVSGTIYSADFAHNLGTVNIAVFVVDVATNKMVRPQEVEILDTNTLRIHIDGNTASLRVSVVTGGTAGVVGGSGATVLDELNDVGSATPTNRNVLVANGTWWVSRALIEADISDFGTYEPAFAKNTAFNKDFGTSAGTVAEGNHTHAEPDKVIRQGHTWAISGEVKVASGDTDFILPFFVSLATGQTAKIVKARHKINSGTSATVKIQKNGVDVTGFTGITVNTTAGTTDPADVALADNDMLALVVTGVSGTPKNLSFTLFIEHTQ